MVRFIGIIALLISSPAQAEDPPVVVANLLLPPLGMMEKEKPTGILYDLLHAIIQRAHIKAEHSIIPVQRVYHELATGRIDVSWMFAPPEMDSVVEKAAEGLDHTISCVSQKDVNLQVYEDLYKYPGIGFLRGAKIGHKIDSDPRVVKTELTDFEQIFQVFASGRIKVACFDEVFYSYYKSNKGIHIEQNGAALRLITRKSYIVVSKNSRHKNLARRISEAAKELRSEGVFEKTLAKYGVTNISQ